MVKDNLNKLRDLMKELKLDYYYIPTDDYHQSEYVGAYFKERAFMSGFNGSAGSLLIGMNDAYLWTDGRYFIQAASDLKDTGISLMKIGEAGVPEIDEFLSSLKKPLRLGFDGRCIPANFGIKLSKISELTIIDSIDLVDSIWQDRPKMSSEKAYFLSDEYSGLNRLNKIKDLREEQKKLGASYSLISSLDDICWLLNIRGNDVACTPVVLSYLLVGNDKINFYLDSSKLDTKMVLELEKARVQIKDYNQIYNDLESLHGESIIVDLDKINYKLYSSIDQKLNHLIIHENLTTLKKAIKNSTEIKNMRQAHIIDAKAVIRTIRYVKENAGKGITELSVANYLHNQRAMSSHFIEDSFETIAGFKEHGAIVHYEPTKETDILVLKDNLLLLDSGGHYLEGTTDITRTIVTGKISKEMKNDFTLVLKSYLALSDAIFKEGARGVTLDMLARKPFWDQMLDFNHGTGHGVGYLLNVHEGPQGIKYNRYHQVEFKEGMITSDEPGLYLEGKYGIRHESLVLTKKYGENEFGTFLRFEPITLVPFDRDGINKKLLTKEERKKLNDYHKLCYEKISPYLDGADLRFLKKATKKI